MNYDVEEDAELLAMMREMFVQRNRDRADELKEAIAAGDTARAHRIAHTLKGNAAQVGETGLNLAAAEAEALLKTGGAVPGELLSRLGAELALAIERIEALLPKEPEEGGGAPPPDAAQAMALFGKLETMLDELDPGCFGLLGELRAIPGTEGLAYQIEEFDLRSAARTLAVLKEKWRGRDGEEKQRADSG